MNENQLNILQYEVERSADGRNFVKIHTTAARPDNGTNILTYNWLDTHPFTGDNFYRVRSIGNNGVVAYTAIVKVSVLKKYTSFIKLKFVKSLFAILLLIIYAVE